MLFSDFDLVELDETWDETIYSEFAFYAWYVLQVVLYNLIEWILVNQ